MSLNEDYESKFEGECEVGWQCRKREECPAFKEKESNLKALTPVTPEWSKLVVELTDLGCNGEKNWVCCQYRVDCGEPPLLPGADYGDFNDTKYQANFFFGCIDRTFRLTGESSRKTSIVTCQEDGVWDFGNLRCEGPVGEDPLRPPVCEDPMRPPDGEQISESYELGSKISFTCNKPGYVPIDDSPIECVKEPECKVVMPLGITSGKIPDSAIRLSGYPAIPDSAIPDSAINATQLRNYEARNIRMNSVTGWCGQQEALTYANVDLGLVHWVKAILVKGVITSDVRGRPTELRLIYKEQVSGLLSIIQSFISIYLCNCFPGKGQLCHPLP